jgi:geranylgeranylglycerol-phosphate geranylgeranyltransferase
LIKKIFGFIKLTRPENNFITALSVFVGAKVAGDIESWEKVIFACLSAFFISAGGNSINDFFDLEIDRVNKPYRPLPQGEILPSSVLPFSFVLFLLGIFLSIGVRSLGMLLAFLASGILILYSSRLKRTLLWGNLTVSFVSALAFIYGGIATKDFRLSLIPATFAFLFHLGREILKDVEDIKGDSFFNTSTLPIKLGVDFSLGICTYVFSFLIVLTVLPYLLHIFSFLYLLVVIFGVDLIIVYVIWSMWHNHSSSNLHRLSNILKMDMLLGLAAIYVGRF